jgi:hypothetical protein
MSVWLDRPSTAKMQSGGIKYSECFENELHFKVLKVFEFQVCLCKSLIFVLHVHLIQK